LKNLYFLLAKKVYDLRKQVYNHNNMNRSNPIGHFSHLDD